MKLLLKTPVGEILVRINDEIRPSYCVEKLNNSLIGLQGLPIYDVDGRYKISVCINDLKAPLCIECNFDQETLFDNSGVSSGERLALKTWEIQNLMFSIGTEDEIEGIDIEYLERGVKVSIKKDKIVDIVVFGVSWVYINDYEKEHNYTWFAADPTYISD